jgi:hypothetical protein
MGLTIKQETLQRLTKVNSLYPKVRSVGSSDVSPDVLRELRAVVQVIGGELGFDPVEPPLPNFDRGEQVLGAAVRVLELEGARAAGERWEHTLAVHTEAGAQLRDALSSFRDLRDSALATRADTIEAGKVPTLPTAATLDAMARARALLELLGIDPDGGDVHTGYADTHPLGDRRALELASIGADEWPSIGFYVGAVRSKVQHLSDSDRERPPRLHAVLSECDHLLNYGTNGRPKSRACAMTAFAVREVAPALRPRPMGGLEEIGLVGAR